MIRLKDKQTQEIGRGGRMRNSENASESYYVCGALSRLVLRDSVTSGRLARLQARATGGEMYKRRKIAQGSDLNLKFCNNILI